MCVQDDPIDDHHLEMSVRIACHLKQRAVGGHLPALAPEAALLPATEESFAKRAVDQVVVKEWRLARLACNDLLTQQAVDAELGQVACVQLGGEGSGGGGGSLAITCTEMAPICDQSDQRGLEQPSRITRRHHERLHSRRISEGVTRTLRGRLWRQWRTPPTSPEAYDTALRQWSRDRRQRDCELWGGMKGALLHLCAWARLGAYRVLCGARRKRRVG